MSSYACAGERGVQQLHWGDILTIVLYFCIVLSVGLWATVRAKKGNARGYFLAGKTMTFIPIGASIFASNIGAPLFVGLTGTAAASGIGGLIFEWHAIPFILMLSWVFVPVFIASGVFTMPEYLEKRYGGKRLRLYISVLSILLYIITKISVEMYAGAVFVQMLLGWNMYISGILVLVFSAAFTMSGGLTAVIFTDTLQTFVLIIGALILLFTGLNEIGGYYGLRAKYMEAIPNTTRYGNTTCGYPRDDSFSLLRDPVTSDYPWPGTIIFNSMADIWFWCSDQIMVQRALSAKNLSHAKGGSVVAGYLKILPFPLFVIPGMIARILYPDEVACATPDECLCVCENPAGCSNIAYPLMVIRLLSPGFRGLMLAAFFAAVMSTLTSVFNSASSIFTLDLYSRFRKRASQWELLLAGRLFVLVLAGCAILWIPIMRASQGDELFKYWQMLMSSVGPPWAVTFVMGFVWKRTTEPAAFYGLICGQLLGFTRLILAFIYPDPLCGEADDRPGLLKIHFLYVAAMQSGLSFTIMVIVSLFTTPRTDDQLKTVTWWTRHEEGPAPTIDDIIDPPDTRDKPSGGWRHALSVMCGMDSSGGEKLSMEEVLALQKKMTSIKEKRSTRIFLNINAVIVLAVATFLIILYK